jgi:hypothetical protein
VSYFSDVLKVLDRLHFIKRFQQTAADVEDLKKRSTALEEKLGEKWPADVCLFCGARAARSHFSAPGHDGKGYQRQDWICYECKKLDTRVVKIK